MIKEVIKVQGGKKAICICDNCGKEFERRYSIAKKSKQQACSDKCRILLRVSKKPHNYNPFYVNCSNCGKQIKVMCFLGTDHCSENCRKDLEKEKNNETNQGK